ncbi:unnamed protein product [Arctogadus glacialis]
MSHLVKRVKQARLTQSLHCGPGRVGHRSTGKGSFSDPLKLVWMDQLKTQGVENP